MDYVGIDLHKKESQICILSGGGQLSECRIRTAPQRFAEVLGGRPRARILLEASTESEWVARCLEALGHEVVVADPNFAPMYARGPGRSRPIDGTHGRWPRPACWGRTARPTVSRTRSGMCEGTWRCARPWSGRGPGTSP
jgi:hypothetical protein